MDSLSPHDLQSRVAPSTETRAMSAMQQALDALEGSIGMNEKMAIVLRERLDPILGSDEPTPDPGDALTSVDPPHSLFVMNVIGLAHRLDTTTALLRMLERRLEV